MFLLQIGTQGESLPWAYEQPPPQQRNGFMSPDYPTYIGVPSMNFLFIIYVTDFPITIHGILT